MVITTTGIYIHPWLYSHIEQVHVHSSSRVSPFKAVYGRDATTPLVLLGSTEKPKTRLISDYCAELEFTLKEVHATVAEKIKKAQIQQKQNYDARNTAHIRKKF